LIEWKEPRYSFFGTRPKPFHATFYLSLGCLSDPNNIKANVAIFKGYYEYLEEIIANTWRVTLEMITYYHGIANFKETRHEMWIQARKDPDNQ
jgi:hypothetical protein